MIYTGADYISRRVRSRKCGCNAISLLDDSIRESSCWRFNPLVAFTQSCLPRSNLSLTSGRYRVVLVPPTAMQSANRGAASPLPPTRCPVLRYAASAGCGRGGAHSPRASTKTTPCTSRS